MNFWNWLDTNASWIQADDGKAIADNADKITEEFNSEFPDLTWEIEIADEDTWYFVVSADGDLDKFGQVIEVFENAPDLENWTIIPFRQPGALDVEIELDSRTLTYDNIWSEVEVVEHEGHSGVNLRLLVEGLDDENEDELASAATILLDNALGEFDAATCVFSLAVERLEGTPESSEFLFPLADLPDFIAGLTDAE